MEKVCILGSGNWGSAIARVVGQNTRIHPLFQDSVNMWVYDELVNGESLAKIINTKHQNVKYLPGIDLPENIIAVTDITKAVLDATVLVIVLPHQFVSNTCKQLKGKVASTTKVISLVKGIDTEHGLSFYSKIIQDILNVEVSVMMGANVADEVALEKFCETTIGCRNKEHQPVYQQLFDRPYFKVNIIEDVIGTEICGALKNVVALAAGFCDGLNLGGNTKAALIRIGLMEIIGFSRTVSDEIQLETFFESCGVADLITTCYNGRNRKLAEAFVKTGKSFEVLEKEMLNGQHLQGPPTAKEVYLHLKRNNLETRFPLFKSVYLISYENVQPSHLLDLLLQRKL